MNSVRSNNSLDKKVEQQKWADEPHKKVLLMCGAFTVCLNYANATLQDQFAVQAKSLSELV